MGILNWPKPWCKPFRDLLSHPPALRYMFDLIGNHFRFENANGNSPGSEPLSTNTLLTN